MTRPLTQGKRAEKEDAKNIERAFDRAKSNLTRAKAVNVKLMSHLAAAAQIYRDEEISEALGTDAVKTARRKSA